ncbi:MAG: pyruvate, phosphate dikinase, partial [Anaerolineae bacterium]|nr:pyruvate, phosphate dikinase [Anaerolineae bacterium]
DSQFSQRVTAYREAVTHSSFVNQKSSIAVVVQKMVQADLAGVLFTADPLTGSHTYLVGNFVQGLGEQLVSGEADAEEFRIERPSGKYEGTPAMKQYAKKLFKMADQLAEQFENPQDIEWAVADGHLFLLQSRPITTMQGYNPVTGAFNDSLQGDYLWTNSNLGEAFPDVMTPITWSLIQIYGDAANPLELPGNHPMFGNIGGRVYMNMSLMYSMLRAIGFSRERINKESEEFFGHLPDNLEIPTVPFKSWQIIRRVAPRLVPIKLMRRKIIGELPGFIAQNPAQVDMFRHQIQSAVTSSDLANVWLDGIRPHFRRASRMLQVGTSRYENAYRPLRRTLQAQVGETAAITLLSGVSVGDSQLASLEPLVGMWRVANGELSREAYLHQFGHRGPHEMELSIPQPTEDPTWLDEQIANLANTDVPAMLKAQEAKKESAWADYTQRFPKDAAKLQTQLDETAAYARGREAVRSEFTRTISLMRWFVLRAGELTGLGDDAFFLSIEELIEVLTGRQTACPELVEGEAVSEISARRQAYETFCALPPYPAIINGRFHPTAWAANPNRRSDFFDAHAKSNDAQAANGNRVTGFPGSSGVVEGVVRVLHNLEESNQLQPGEILVTVTTNIGWTPVFPKVTAVVTDVGAPLSHAAIVAREMGIPAVVGCGNATMRLRTGDRVHVDGGQGVITIL